LINPLTIDEKGNLLAGKRRFLAIKELGWQEVGVVELPIDGDQLKALKITIDENLKHKPLTDPENRALIALYDELKKRKEGQAMPVGYGVTDGWSYSKTADDLSISKATVSQAVKAENYVKKNPRAANKKTKQIIRELKIEEQIVAIKHLRPIEGAYDVIVIDPPWATKGEYDPGGRRAIPDYPMMSYEEIADIKLPASGNCILWLWVTNLNIHDGFHLIEKWGFEFKNILTWAKDRYGLGAWLRGQTEHCLLAIKGEPIFTGESLSTLLIAPSTGHSIKPDAFYELVDQCCYGNKIDYFGGKERNGWQRYGAKRISL